MILYIDRKYIYGSASLFCHGQIRSKAVNVTTTLQLSFSFKVVGCEVPSAPPKGNAHPLKLGGRASGKLEKTKGEAAISFRSNSANSV